MENSDLLKILSKIDRENVDTIEFNKYFTVYLSKGAEYKIVDNIPSISRKWKELDTYARHKIGGIMPWHDDKYITIFIDPNITSFLRKYIPFEEVD